MKRIAPNGIHGTHGIAAHARIALLALAMFAALGAAAFAANLIGEAKAREIVLAHSGIPAAEANFVKVRLYRRHYAPMYDIVLIGKNVKFKYDLNAETGEIVSFHRNGRNGGYGSGADLQGSAGDYIGIERAKEIAFAHAKVDGTKVYRLEVDMDRDDGRMIYEVDFKHDGWEYEYEIDATTGKVLYWDKERD
ncbi:PepSY domain-containing protein [Synergistaceae bacterium OttesenSCG-928-I11]|nr:PepSY domain-containing protein [Synergistaceae bacterium OttesenSCG-928-I11]